MMKKALFLAALLCPLFCFAGGRSTAANVADLHYMNNGVVLFYTTTTHSGVPTCAASYTTRWAIDASTPAGKSQLAGLLSAYHTGKRIEVFGTGACSAWSDTETVSYFHVVE